MIVCLSTPQISEDKLLQIRITNIQKDIILKMAKDNNKTVSNFILDLIQEYYIKNTR